MLHLFESVIQALVGHNHEMGFCTLFCIGHLARQDVVELFRRHAGARQHAGALDMGGRRDHHHRIHPRVAAGFEQQRNVEHHHFGAVGHGFGEEFHLLARHQRMDDGFQLLEAIGG